MPIHRLLLRRKLATGSDPEIRSALSALARRPDGIADVVALATDHRPWVHVELAGAFAYVSAPLSEDQIAYLDATLPDREWPRALAIHRRRVARGGGEYGPDGAFVVPAQSAAPAVGDD